MLKHFEELVPEHSSVSNREEGLSSDAILLLGIPITDSHRDNPPQSPVMSLSSFGPSYLVKVGSNGKDKEGVVVEKVGKSLVVVLVVLDATNHILKQRIRSTSVTTTASVSAKIMAGDFVLEVDGEGVTRAIKGIHWWLLIVVDGLDDGKLLRCTSLKRLTFYSKSLPPTRNYRHWIHL